MAQIIVFVVAIAFVTVTADQSKCQDGWAFFENSCYYIGDAGLSFADARRTCRGMDAQLAVVSSREENDFIKSLMQNDDATGAWFGYMYYLDHQRVLSWENLDFGKQNFKDWPNNEEPDVTVEGWGQTESDVWLAGSDKGSEGKWYWDINGKKEKISNE
ncbi:C-type lectin domain family 4 member c, partial [Plakobranchus ocellatus]